MEKLERQSPHSNFVKIDDNQLRVISKWYYHAQSSIRKTDVEYRSIIGQTITVNTKDLPKAKELK